MMTSILLIDDNKLHRKVLSDFLQAIGYDLHTAADAESGLHLAHQTLPDLIIMDIQLPGIDGLTATRAVRADADLCHIPIIVLTAQAMKGDREQAYEAGCQMYMSKPFDVNELAACIQQLTSH